MSAIQEPQVPADIHDKPLTARLVYLVLEEHGRMNTKELSHHTGLAPRSVNNGIEGLGDRVVSMQDPEDGRRHIHMLAEDAL